MRKILLSAVLSLTIIAQALTPAFAQVQFVIPQYEEKDFTTLQLEDISSFLEEFEIVKNCLRKPEENREITAVQAVCSILQVFDDRANSNQAIAWERAKKLGLVEADSEKSAKITGFEFLEMLFQGAGVTISPVSEKSYQELFRSYRIRLTKQESKAFATALEKGMIPQPETAKEAQDLRSKLAKKTLKTSEALAFLYQTATSQHDVVNLNPYILNQPKLPLEDVLKEVFAIIRTQSYFNKDFDEEKAMEAAIKAAVKTLESDKYIEYYTSEEYESFSENLNGNLEGIGAYIEEKEDQIIIVSPIEGSPAAKAGLLPGDIILWIDGESTEEMSLQQAVDKIRGPQGSSVTLGIKRNGSELELTIVRNRISVPAISVSNRDNIEIIKLVQFGSSAAAEMKKELETIAQKNPQGIIIDLRNNPGGFLNEVTTIVDYFLEKGKPIVYLQDRHMRTQMDATMDPMIKNIPISILINKGSASASEILAGVLQSYGLAKIYGETSFGKGTVQNIVSLSPEGEYKVSAFKFTTAEYLIPTPGGNAKSIDGTGVKPDSNPGGAESIVDDRLTPQDEALDAVINDMKGGGRRR